MVKEYRITRLRADAEFSGESKAAPLLAIGQYKFALEPSATVSPNSARTDLLYVVFSLMNLDKTKMKAIKSITHGTSAHTNVQQNQTKFIKKKNIVDK